MPTVKCEKPPERPLTASGSLTDFVTTDANGQVVRTAGCDLLEFVGDKVSKKNAFRKQYMAS